MRNILKKKLQKKFCASVKEWEELSPRVERCRVFRKDLKSLPDIPDTVAITAQLYVMLAGDVKAYFLLTNPSRHTSAIAMACIDEAWVLFLPRTLQSEAHHARVQSVRTLQPCRLRDVFLSFRATALTRIHRNGNPVHIVPQPFGDALN